MAEGDNLGRSLRRTVTMSKGYNRIQIAYRSPASGDAVLRVRWQSDSFPVESIPPQILFHTPGDRKLDKQDGLRRGRSLVARLKCLNCHALNSDSWRKASAAVMPELQADAPSLRNIGHRLNEAWIVQWLAEPESLRRDCAMPHLLGGITSDVRQQAADVVAYLQSIGVAEDALSPPSAIEALPHDADQALQRGAALYEQLSCTVCHTMAMPDKSDAIQRHSLAFVSQKFPKRQLARDPPARRISSCEPDAKLPTLREGKR